MVYKAHRSPPNSRRIIQVPAFFAILETSLCSCRSKLLSAKVAKLPRWTRRKSEEQRNRLDKRTGGAKIPGISGETRSLVALGKGNSPRDYEADPALASLHCRKEHQSV